VSVWHTQEVLDVATAALAAQPAAATATAALLEVRMPTDRPPHTAAVLMRKRADGWAIARLYTADQEIPGAVPVVIVGLWADAAL